MNSIENRVMTDIDILRSKNPNAEIYDLLNWVLCDTGDRSLDIDQVNYFYMMNKQLVNDYYTLALEKVNYDIGELFGDYNYSYYTKEGETKRKTGWDYSDQLALGKSNQLILCHLAYSMAANDLIESGDYQYHIPSTINNLERFNETCN